MTMRRSVALTLAALMLCAAAVAAQRSASVATTFRQSTGEGSVEVGIVQVGDAAAGLSSISYAVCELLTATQFEPIDWDLVREFYETPLLIDNEDMSLRDLARSGIQPFKSGASYPGSDALWKQFKAHYDGDAAWLDSAVMYAIDGAVENDGARREMAQKTIRDGFGVAITLAFLEEAKRLIIAGYGIGDQGWKSGLLDAADSILKLWDAAWVTFHGYDNGDGDTGRDCAPYGTGESRSRDFGLPGDVTYVIERSFVNGRNVLESIARGRSVGADLTSSFVRPSDMAALRASYEAITRAIIITYLRSTLQQAARMDRNVPAFPANMRVNQLEGLALFRCIEPIVSNASDTATAHIASVLSVDANMPRADGSIDVAGYEPRAPAVEAAIDELLASLGIDKETQFGALIV